MPVGVGVSEGRDRASLQSLRACRWGQQPQSHWLSNPGQEAEEVLSGVLKITQHAMVKRKRNYGSI